MLQYAGAISFLESFRNLKYRLLGTIIINTAMLNNKPKPSDSYFELKLWGDHELQVWPAGQMAILRHPAQCNIESDHCQHRLLQYIEAEGLFDHIAARMLIIDSYIA